MAIQFACTSCAQPIEVDNGFARQPVQCPYCNSVVTAPQRTTLTASPAVARAVVTSTDAAPATHASTAEVPRRARNPLGTAGFIVAALGTLGLMIGYSMMVFGLLEMGAQAGHSIEEMQDQRVVQSVIESADFGSGAGMVFASGLLLLMLGVLGNLIAFGLSIAGLFTPNAPRGWAIAGVALVCTPVVLLVGMLIVGAGMS